MSLSLVLPLARKCWSSGQLLVETVEIALLQSFLRPLRSNFPAVKIADAPALPLLPRSNDSAENAPTPETCVSEGVPSAVATKSSRSDSKAKSFVATKLDPIDSSLFSVKQEDDQPTLLSDEGNADEFGEFLLDAVQWL